MGISVGESHAGTEGRRVELRVKRVQVESGRNALAVATPENGEPVFFTAGVEASGEFRCSGCGYGVVVRSLLPVCPMCRGHVWEEPDWSPFSN